MNYRTKREAAQIFHSVNMCEDGENSKKLYQALETGRMFLKIMACSNASLDNFGNETLSEHSIQNYQARISNQKNRLNNE